MSRYKQMTAKQLESWGKKLPEGTIVRMVGCAEAELPKYSGKHFKTSGEVIDHYGTPVVFLEGVDGSIPPRGFFAAKFLEVVRDED